MSHYNSEVRKFRRQQTAFLNFSIRPQRKKESTSAYEAYILRKNAEYSRLHAIVNSRITPVVTK